ncbi:aminoacyl-tRNA hydrolase [Magnetospira thiophila]
MLLVVGLGNPGAGYAGNRHNIGFMAVDALVRRHSFGPWRNKFQAELAEGMVAGVKVYALKPLTYMNESGRAVAACAGFYKISVNGLLVFHDDLDLQPGKLRIKAGGGHGGHNGLRSLDAHLGSRDYRRVRLGIGHPGDKERVHGHVLSDFAKADGAWLTPMIDALAEQFPLLVRGDDSGFMNRVALALQPPKQKDD